MECVAWSVLVLLCSVFLLSSAHECACSVRLSCLLCLYIPSVFVQHGDKRYHHQLQKQGCSYNHLNSACHTWFWTTWLACWCRSEDTLHSHFHCLKGHVRYKCGWWWWVTLQALEIIGFLSNASTVRTICWGSFLHLLRTTSSAKYCSFVFRGILPQPLGTVYHSCGNAAGALYYHL